MVVSSGHFKVLGTPVLKRAYFSDESVINGWQHFLILNCNPNLDFSSVSIKCEELMTSVTESIPVHF